MFCELLFHFLTFLGVSFIESYINGEQKLVLKKSKIFFEKLVEPYYLTFLIFPKKIS
jgi:hypothetical protein